MNSKASKQQIQWPPLLNMSDDRPHVDDTFRNVERINAPFVNGMLQPVWIKNLGQEYIHDAEGNKYDVENGVFKRNGIPLFQVENKHFERQDVTDRFVQYHDYDLSDNTEAWTTWDETGKRFNIHFNGNDIQTPVLFAEGFIVTSRIRILNNCAVFVIYYNTNLTDYVQVNKIDLDGTLNTFTQEAEWYIQNPRRSATAAQSWVVLSNILSTDPVIAIADLGLNVIGVSLINKRDTCLDTRRNGFITYFVYNNEMKQLGKTILPNSQTTPTTVENIHNIEWLYYATISTNVGSNNCISSDNGQTYYDYSVPNVVGPEITLPDGQYPTQTGFVTIDGVDYTIYSYQVFKTALKAQTVITIPGPYWKVDLQKTDDTWVTSNFTNGQQCNVAINYQEPYGEFLPNPTVLSVIKGLRIVWKLTATGEEHTKVIELNTENYNAAEILDSYITTETVTAGWLVTPNIVLDNGNLYAMYSILKGYSTANNWNNQTLTAGNIIQDSGKIAAVDWANNLYSISTIEYTALTTNYNVLRSNSFGMSQNFVTSTARLCNTTAVSSFTIGNSGTESENAIFLEMNNTNGSDKRYYPGTFADSSFNYYGDSKGTLDSQSSGPVDDYLCFTVNGYRVSAANNSNFKFLYNVDEANSLLKTGISYSENDDVEGTLLTPWGEVDTDWYVVANSEKVIYKDYNNRYWEISIKDGTRLFSVLDDRYLIVNTTSRLNCYDSQLNQIKHYASDYNNRLMFGTSTLPVLNPAAGSSSPALIKGANTSYIRSTAAGINPIYVRMPRSGITSNLDNKTTRSRVMLEAEKAFACDRADIDVFYSELSSDSAVYRYTLTFEGGVASSKFVTNLSETIYNTNGDYYYNPNIFTEFVNGAGNNDLVKENFASYVLTYNNQQPFLNYKLSSQTTEYGRGQIAFFVLQGQFYIFANEKIYSVIYNGGTVSSMDAIVDARGMQFVGFNPQIAFFYSKAKRMFYSFTSDAILQNIYDASKIKNVTGKYFYDEMTQSIYVPNDAGLLVFGPKNTYMFENWKNVTNVQFSSDGITHITDGDITYDLAYYKTEGFEVLPLKLETSFYGLGGNEDTSIDRWDIVLYDNESSKETSWLKVKTRSLTNVTQESDEKTETITPEMYDKWSSSYLYPYNPGLQKGLGIRLELETPLSVVRIVPHIMDMETGVTNKMSSTSNTIKRYTGGIN